MELLFKPSCTRSAVDVPSRAIAASPPPVATQVKSAKSVLVEEGRTPSSAPRRSRVGDVAARRCDGADGGVRPSSALSGGKTANALVSGNAGGEAPRGWPVYASNAA